MNIVTNLPMEVVTVEDCGDGYFVEGEKLFVVGEYDVDDPSIRCYLAVNDNNQEIVITNEDIKILSYHQIDIA
ncbi:hypothetical protein NSA56_01980 [Oceanobacillus caeni]|uniref:hypothetical protein n=1 Tax=Oceanobacillus caeni TaxID=405946 RepID=UPI00214A6D84|nr:hypothetical protein [Oceanobacillus caeni]MCR1833166.1 hypothetical protein [Oceanobacillus caeni]